MGLQPLLCYIVRFVIQPFVADIAFAGEVELVIPVGVVGVLLSPCHHFITFFGASSQMRGNYILVYQH